MQISRFLVKDSELVTSNLLNAQGIAEILNKLLGLLSENHLFTFLFCGYHL